MNESSFGSGSDAQAHGSFPPPVSHVTQPAPVIEDDGAGLALQPRPAVEFFAMELGRIPLWSLMRNESPLRWPVIAIALGLAKLGVKITATPDRPAVETLLPFAIDVSCIAPEDMVRLQEALKPVHALGFGEPTWFQIEDLTHNVLTHVAVTLHGPTGVIGLVFERFWFSNQKKKSLIVTELISPLSNGGLMITSNCKPDEEIGLSFDTKCIPKGKVEKLWDLHQTRIKQPSGAGLPVRVQTQDQAIQTVERYQNQLNKSLREQGVLRAMTDKEKQQLRINEQSHDMLADRPTSERMVFAHMNAPKSSWSAMGTVLLLVVSFLAFIAAKNTVADTWKQLAIIAGIIFVHELGHYLAMMLFGYRDLKMFFIPGLGAAVAGKPVNPTAWKRSVVALAGPLPGIVLGLIFGIFGVIRSNELLTEICVMALIINGFNLLPFLPLDGGHVLHATLFSRNYVFDVIFRVIAAVFLLLLAIGLQAKGMIALLVIMLMSVPVIIGNGKITQELRRKRFEPVEAPEGLNFAPENARAVLPQVVSAFPKSSLKQHAEFAEGIINDLSAKPPGVLATLGILGLHGATFGLALLALLGMAMAHSPVLQSAFRAGMATAEWDSTPFKDVQTWAGPQGGPEVSEPRITIIGQAASAAEAKAQFTLLRQSLPPEADLLQMGKTVLVGLPEANQELKQDWLKKLEGPLSELRVDHSEMRFMVSMMVLAATKSEAEAIIEELKQIGQAPGVDRLIPPWSPHDPRTPEQVELDRKARKTYRRFSEVGSEFYRSPEFTSISKKRMQAQRVGNKAGVEQANSELQKLQLDYELKRIEKLRAEPDADPRVCDVLTQTAMLCTNREDMKKASEARLEKLLPLMGALPDATANSPQVALCRNSAIGAGVAYFDGSELTVTSNLSFVRPTVGIPAFIRWLEQHKMDRNVRFEYSTYGLPTHGNAVAGIFEEEYD